YSITQDSTGFMWFATYAGLVRYDGYEVTSFRYNRASGNNFSEGYIKVVENDNKNGLWAGSNSGLLFFNTSTGENRKIDLGGDRDIDCILKQNDTTLWAGSTDGLFKVNLLDESFVLYEQQNSKLSSNIIRSLYLSGSKDLWVGTFDGLNRIRTDGTIQHYDLKNNYKPELKNNLILDIKPFSEGSDSLLWVGTETGLVLLDTHRETFDVVNNQNTDILNEVIKCVYSKIPGQVYFGTDLGFYRYDINTKEVSSSFHDPFNQYSIANNTIWDIIEDNSGVLWLATSNGVSKLNFSQNKFQFTPIYIKAQGQIIGTRVNDIYKDKNGTIWLATNQGVKVYHPDGSTQDFTTQSSPDEKIVLNTVGTITGDALGRIWIGSAGGINIWDPRAKTMTTITANFEENTGLRTNYIASFLTPADGSFWVTTWGGGIYKAQGNFSNVDNISFRFIADFNAGFYAANKKIWICDYPKVYALDIVTSEVETYEQLNKEIQDVRISAIHLSTRGELWIAAENLLFKYQIQSQKVERYSFKTGDRNLIYELVEDRSGNIWGTTLTSIFKFDLGKSAFETYPKSEAIALDNATTPARTDDGGKQLFFGGNDGYISFYPENVNKSNFRPSLLITNLSVGGQDVHSLNDLNAKNSTNKQITFTDQVILNHDQNNLQLHFSSLHLTEPKRNIYAYKLDNYETDWIYTTGDRNFASYTNLPSGDYTFTVKGTNNDGVWIENETRLSIVISPPFWASPFAYIFYLLVLIVAVILLKRAYRNKIKWEEELKLIKVEKEKNEEIAFIKQRFFTNVSHEFRTPLTLILGPIDNLLKKSQLTDSDRFLVSLVQKNAKRLLSLINQLLDLRKIETSTLQLKYEEFDIIAFCKKQYEMFVNLAENKQINYRFEASIPSLPFDGDQIRFESIIQNLLSNAFKSTPDQGHIVFKIEIIDQSVIKISVKDSGIGISDEHKDLIFARFSQISHDSKKSSGSGIGLNITKEYCELMSGKIWVESELEMGSTFFVELPIPRINSEEEAVGTVIDNSVSEGEPFKKRIPNISRNLHTLLLVDDHADTLEYLQFSLKKYYSILVANNGQKGFKILGNHKIDLIISDIMMDEMDGIEFCTKVKQHPKYESIPVILLTARTMDTQKIEGFHAGADAYLTKPFSLDLLKTQIENLISKKDKINDFIKRKLIISNREVELESADEKLLKETIQYINKHITNTEINLKEMSRSIGVSYSSLFRKIKFHTGLKLNELVRIVRLKKAEELLKTGKMNIAEVMYETGFSSHSYFAKCFKKEYGVAPKKYLQSKK
ncbi:MAG: response regulator, partial [Bacteroidetes bacterium]|nr:response regulator [Bacteroidota bacterium]